MLFANSWRETQDKSNTQKRNNLKLPTKNETKFTYFIQTSVLIQYEITGAAIDHHQREN